MILIRILHNKFFFFFSSYKLKTYTPHSESAGMSSSLKSQHVDVKRPKSNVFYFCWFSFQTKQTPHEFSTTTRKKNQISLPSFISALISTKNKQSFHKPFWFLLSFDVVVIITFCRTSATRFVSSRNLALISFISKFGCIDFRGES